MKVVIVGAGRIGVRHAEHIDSIGELVAVVDINPNNGKSLANKYGANFFETIEQFVRAGVDADLVAICTPNGLHCDHTILSLNAGYNVLCEKPMALSTSDCESMIACAKANNRLLFVVKQNRFNPPVEAVKNLLDGNKLGQLFSVQLSCIWNRNEQYYKDSWRGTKNMDGGILFTQFSHFIDLIVWLIGDIEILEARVENVSKRADIEFEDTCVVSCRFSNGALGTLNFSINSFNENMEGSITILGECGTVKIGGQYLNVLEYQNIKGTKLKNLPEGRPANNYGHYSGSMSNHGKVYENVFSALNNQASNLANGEDGLKTIQLIERIYNSNR